MELKNYETVFILTPVLSDEQMKDTVDTFMDVLKNNGAEIVNEERWGLKKLAYPIMHKSTGFYSLVEYNAELQVIAILEKEFKRDEKVMRFLTIAIEKHKLEYNAKRRRGEFNKKDKEETKKEDKAA